MILLIFVMNNSVLEWSCFQYTDLERYSSIHTFGSAVYITTFSTARTNHLSPLSISSKSYLSEISPQILSVFKILRHPSSICPSPEHQYCYISTSHSNSPVPYKITLAHVLLVSSHDKQHNDILHFSFLTINTFVFQMRDNTSKKFLCLCPQFYLNTFSKVIGKILF